MESIFGDLSVGCFHHQTKKISAIVTNTNFSGCENFLLPVSLYLLIQCNFFGNQLNRDGKNNSRSNSNAFRFHLNATKKQSDLKI